MTGSRQAIRQAQPTAMANQGQSLVLFLLMAPLLLTLLLLVHDAGSLFIARRELQNAADAAARAGADAMSEERYRALEGQGSDAFGFDPWRAEDAARAYLLALNDPHQPFEASIDTGGRAVIVTLRRAVPTLLLRSSKFGRPVVTATGIAEPQNR